MFKIVSEDPSFDFIKRLFVSESYAQKICDEMNLANGFCCFKVVEIESNKGKEGEE